jgi:hypothetical protein
LSGVVELGLRVFVEFDGVPPMLLLPIGPVDVDGICEPPGVVGMLVEPVEVVGGVSLPVVPVVPARDPVVPPAELLVVLSTPSADSVAESALSPPDKPCACLKLRIAWRVFGPITPSTGPGSKPRSDKACWICRT